MSKYVKGRSTKMIGCNIRRGMIPGGFVQCFANGSSRVNRPKVRASSVAVRAAANAVLLKRGVLSQPSAFEASVITAYEIKNETHG